MRTINGTTYNREQLEIVRKFFTDDQWDIIDYALSEYQDHDETFELTRETQDRYQYLKVRLLPIKTNKKERASHADEKKPTTKT